MRNESLLYSFLTEIGAEKISRSNANNLKCTCPFASHTHAKGTDSNPSFFISLDESSKWNCFSCGQKGRSFRTLVRALSSTCGRDLSSWENAEITNAEGNKEHSLSKKKNFIQIDNWQIEEQISFNWRDFEHLIREVPPYAKERGLTDEQIKKWKIGWNKRENKLFIPIFNHDKWFVGFSERSTKV
jgi:DNA primase